jgi:phospholipase C
MPAYVYVTQNVAETLSGSSSVLPALDPRYWSNPSGPTDLPQARQTEVLWMDRDVGITDGDTWVFTSQLEISGTEVLLQEKVTGTLVSSTIAIQIEAPGQTTNWQSNVAKLQFTASDGSAYLVSGSFYRPPGGDYDNVSYVISSA